MTPSLKIFHLKAERRKRSLQGRRLVKTAPRDVSRLTMAKRVLVEGADVGAVAVGVGSTKIQSIWPSKQSSLQMRD
jgi:hypothetical protein